MTERSQGRAADPYQTSATLLGKLNDPGEDREVIWERFYGVYAPVIAGFARRMGVSPQDVRDLVHDVLAGFYAKSPEFVYDPARGRFRGYLKTCTWRKLQDRGRKQRFKVDGRPIEEVEDSAVAVEQAWNDVWEREKLQRAVALVRERYQSRADRADTFRAFEMVVVLGRPVEDVARELGMKPNSVHTAKSRVSKAIQSQYQALDDDAE